MHESPAMTCTCAPRSRAITPETAGWRFLSFRWGPFAEPVREDTGTASWRSS